MAPFSQELESPENPGRFSCRILSGGVIQPSGASPRISIQSACIRNPEAVHRSACRLLASAPWSAAGEARNSVDGQYGKDRAESRQSRAAAPLADCSFPRRRRATGGLHHAVVHQFAPALTACLRRALLRRWADVAIRGRIIIVTVTSVLMRPLQNIRSRQAWTARQANYNSYSRCSGPASSGHRPTAQAIRQR
ncbi:hypothetical protein SAMN05444172_9007 [Burkholderia sp. GAS332]|nr:hypothetical protein SAMN05444172_9007 [Burkholderia sp. GAS332]